MTHEYALENDNGHWWLLQRPIPEGAVKLDDAAWIRIAEFTVGPSIARQVLNQLQTTK